MAMEEDSSPVLSRLEIEREAANAQGQRRSLQRFYGADSSSRDNDHEGSALLPSSDPGESSAEALDVYCGTIYLASTAPLLHPMRARSVLASMRILLNEVNTSMPG